MRSFRRDPKRLVLAVAMALATATSGALAQSQRKGPVPDAEARLAFYEQHEAMKETSRYRDLEWEFIGPEVMSGRITGIAVPPGSRYTMYVASASGGVWKTENEGTTWEPIFEDAPSQSVGAVSIAPSNPDHVWVGGGEANVFRSSMSGVGVHLSPDGGETWERTLYVDERTGVYDLRIDPRNPDVLYAATWERIRRKWMDPKPGPGTSIYKSTDGGETWREIDEGLPADRATHGRIGIDIARSDPDVLYAFLDNHESARTAEEGERDAHGRERENVIKGNGVPNTFVHDLIVHPRDDILVIATHGRGMYAMDARPIQAMARE